MTEPIKPALTAEEWASLHVKTPHSWGGESFVVIEDRDEGQLRCGYAPSDGGEGWASFPANSPERHALAALALYGQTFGFKREDVSGLRMTASHLAHVEPLAKGLNFIADRIEALLPPE